MSPTGQAVAPTARAICRTIRVRGRSRWSRTSPGGIQTVGSVLYHELRLSGMHELGDTAGRLDLVDNPVPIPDRLHGHRGASLTPREKLLERPPLMRDPLFANEPAVLPGH